jgi:hypothetical protein
MQVVEVPPEELVLNDRNPRRMRPERWATFLKTLEQEKEMTQARPVIALRKNKRVIAGNQRVRGARALGWQTIPVVFVELDELRATTWMFLDNHSFGEDDEDLAAVLLAELKERGGDLDLTGFHRAETDALLRRLLYRDRDPDMVLPVPEDEPDSKPGQSYKLGPHRLLCGDATDPEQVHELLGDASPLLLATDPPYGVGLENGWRDEVGVGSRRRSGRHRHTSIRGDERSDWSGAYELVPSLTVAYVWMASVRACEVEAGLERIGFRVRQQLIWDKCGFVLSRGHYHWAHEPCLHATRIGAQVRWYGPRNQSTVWRAASPKMASSGSAASGALTGRVCYAIEIDPRCCDLIRERWQVFSHG